MTNSFYLADAVCVDGESYLIHTDYRTWIGFEIIMSSDMSFFEKCIRAIKLCYIELPPRLDAGIGALMDFYSLGEKKRNHKVSKPLFDFEKDFGYIYASFAKEYNIDLFEENIHWHKFMYLLRSLGDECIFKKIISYRGADINKIKDKNQKAFIRRMKHLYALDMGEYADLSDAF